MCLNHHCNKANKGQWCAKCFDTCIMLRFSFTFLNIGLSLPLYVINFSSWYSVRQNAVALPLVPLPLPASTWPFCYHNARACNCNQFFALM